MRPVPTFARVTITASSRVQSCQRRRHAASAFNAGLRSSYVERFMADLEAILQLLRKVAADNEEFRLEAVRQRKQDQQFIAKQRLLDRQYLDQRLFCLESSFNNHSQMFRQQSALLLSPIQRNRAMSASGVGHRSNKLHLFAAPSMQLNLGSMINRRGKPVGARVSPMYSG
jgi:hypothetical protein